jgi:hypothetical protein
MKNECSVLIKGWQFITGLWDPAVDLLGQPNEVDPIWDAEQGTWSLFGSSVPDPATEFQLHG